MPTKAKKKLSEKASYAAAVRLYKAVAAYIRFHGGAVVVAGDIQVIQYPTEPKFNFTVAVKCTGKKPESEERTDGQN